MMLPENMRDWVGKDHLVWFVIDVIEGLDTAGLEGLGKPGRGRPGYDPRMLAVLLVYAYLQGERSSRRIEERCRTDAAFRVATGNLVPDHSTIARFRAAGGGRGRAAGGRVPAGPVQCWRMRGWGGWTWSAWTEVEDLGERVEAGEPDRGRAAEAGPEDPGRRGPLRR